MSLSMGVCVCVCVYLDISELRVCVSLYVCMCECVCVCDVIIFVGVRFVFDNFRFSGFQKSTLLLFMLPTPSKDSTLEISLYCIVHLLNI